MILSHSNTEDEEYTMINSRICDYSTLHVNVKSLRTGYSRDLSGEVWWLCLQKRSNFLSLFCFSLLRTHFLCINSLSDKKNVGQKLTNFSKGQNLGFFWLKWKKLSLTNNLVRQRNSLTVLTGECSLSNIFYSVYSHLRTSLRHITSTLAELI